ncbi:hypothetical protein NST07_20695 [Paenibacillus sp. FSL L8-0340]|uniref:hypothetical protein n=1 Tax=Paenibacillus sp. FSL L8-0340 TaxID=2954685 RepID=UPI00315835AF
MEKWVIKTNQGRYVTIPFILTSGFRSYLNNSPTAKDTRRYSSADEAQEYYEKYLAGRQYYVDKYTFQNGEALSGIEKVENDALGRQAPVTTE